MADTICTTAYPLPLRDPVSWQALQGVRFGGRPGLARREGCRLGCSARKGDCAWGCAQLTFCFVRGQWMRPSDKAGQWARDTPPTRASLRPTCEKASRVPDRQRGGQKWGAVDIRARASDGGWTILGTMQPAFCTLASSIAQTVSCGAQGSL